MAAPASFKGSLWVWLIAVFVLIVMLEFAPKLGGVLLLALVVYLAVQVEKRGSA